MATTLAPSRLLPTKTAQKPLALALDPRRSTQFKPAGFLASLGSVDSSGNDNSLTLPARTSYSSILPGIQSSLGSAPSVTAPTLGSVSNINVPTLAQAPTLSAPREITVPNLASVTAIPGYDDSFFDSLFEESKNKLNKSVFGSGGTLERETENLTSRGLLGSSIESDKRGQITDQYNEQLGSVLSDLNRLKQEQAIEDAKEMRRLQQERDLATSKYTFDAQQSLADRELEREKTQAGFQQERDLTGAKFEFDAATDYARRQQEQEGLAARLALDAGSKNAEMESAMKELGLRSALTEASDISKYDLGKYEQDVKLEEIGSDAEQDRRRLMLDLLSSPQVDIASSDQSSILDSLFGATGVPGYGSSSSSSSSSGSSSSATGSSVKSSAGRTKSAIQMDLNKLNAKIKSTSPTITSSFKGASRTKANPAYTKMQQEKEDLINTLLGL